VLAGLVVGEQARLATSLVVREDSLTLYGFGTDQERQLFDLLLGVSGIGPRLALAILTVLGPDEVRAAVAADDIATLTRVPGVGRKGAQRLVLELKDRLAPVSAALESGMPGSTAVAARGAWAEQVSAALVSLGWGARDAATALDAVAPTAAAMTDNGQEPDVAALLRLALRCLDRPS
jgi:Holliday junction DNA helicase RuvA